MPQLFTAFFSTETRYIPQLFIAFSNLEIHCSCF
jgi:hypothetical protein